MQLIRLHSYQVEMEDWEQPGRLRLAVLSDLHNNIYPGLIEMLEAARPDAVLIAGDMVNRPMRRQPPRFSRGYGCVKKLAERFPVYYAMGNHESSWQRHPKYGESFAAYKRALEKKGVRFLDNESAEAGDAAHPLILTGLSLGKAQFTHRFWRRKAPDAELIKTLVGAPAARQILIAHHPQYADAYREWGAKIILSGHLHGGIVRLFGRGLIGPGPDLFPKYSGGLYDVDGARLIVSAGLGTHTLPFRVFNPREALIVDLIKEQHGNSR